MHLASENLLSRWTKQEKFISSFMILWEDSGNRTWSATILATSLSTSLGNLEAWKKLLPLPTASASPLPSSCLLRQRVTHFKSTPSQTATLLDTALFWNQMACVSSCIPVPLRNDMGGLGRHGPHLRVTHKLQTHTKPSIQWIRCLICAEPQHPNILWGFRKHNTWTWEFAERKYCAPWLCSDHTLSFSDGQHPPIWRISYTRHLKFYKKNAATDDSSMKTRLLALERNKPDWGHVLLGVSWLSNTWGTRINLSSNGHGQMTHPSYTVSFKAESGTWVP